MSGATKEHPYQLRRETRFRAAARHRARNRSARRFGGRWPDAQGAHCPRDLAANGGQGDGEACLASLAPGIAPRQLCGLAVALAASAARRFGARGRPSGAHAVRVTGAAAANSTTDGCAVSPVRRESPHSHVVATHIRGSPLPIDARWASAHFPDAHTSHMAVWGQCTSRRLSNGIPSRRLSCPWTAHFVGRWAGTIR